MNTIKCVPKSLLMDVCIQTILQSYRKNNTDIPDMTCLPESDTLVIGFRGIKAKNVEDWIECLSYLQDKPVNEKLEREVRKLIETHHKSKIYLTGHSLGGYKATILAHKLRYEYPHVQTIVFNPACICDSGYESRIDQLKTLTTYHIVGDILSSLAGLENPSGIYRINNISTKQHNIHTFIN